MFRRYPWLSLEFDLEIGTIPLKRQGLQNIKHQVFLKENLVHYYKNPKKVTGPVDQLLTSRIAINQQNKKNLSAVASNLRYLVSKELPF